MFTITLFVNPTEIWPVGPQKEVVTIVKGGRERNSATLWSETIGQDTGSYFATPASRRI
jgi:hypothetical protein